MASVPRIQSFHSRGSQMVRGRGRWGELCCEKGRGLWWTPRLGRGVLGMGSYVTAGWGLALSARKGSSE